MKRKFYFISKRVEFDIHWMLFVFLLIYFSILPPSEKFVTVEKTSKTQIAVKKISLKANDLLSLREYLKIVWKK
jgi:hypothetical protein